MNRGKCSCKHRSSFAPWCFLNAGLLNLFLLRTILNSILFWNPHFIATGLNSALHGTCRCTGYCTHKHRAYCIGRTTEHTGRRVLFASLCFVRNLPARRSRSRRFSCGRLLARFFAGIFLLRLHDIRTFKLR